MFALRAMGLLIPSASAGILARMRGVLLIILLIIALLAIGLGIVELSRCPSEASGSRRASCSGLFLVIAALGVLAAVGRRRRDRAKKRRLGLTGRRCDTRPRDD